METLELQLVPEVSLVVNDTLVLLQGSSGLCLWKVVEEPPHRGRKTLSWCFKANNTADPTSHKAVGWQEDNVLEILIDLECSLTLLDEIYSYQVFFYDGDYYSYRLDPR